MTWHEWDEDTVAAAMMGAFQAYRNGLESTCELADVRQEAHIFIATRPEQVDRQLNVFGLKGVVILVRSRMTDLFRKEQAAQKRAYPLPEAAE